jgi:orotidine-5'-phosphate decarboxylase
MTDFTNQIIDATCRKVCAFKPNRAFYINSRDDSAENLLGWTIDHARAVASDVPIILDAKYGDIGKTNGAEGGVSLERYVAEAFERYQADAVTVHSYLGPEAMKPFLDCREKGIIVLCRTSNKGAERYQDCLRITTDSELAELMPKHDKNLEIELGWRHLDLATTAMPYYQFVALDVARRWNYNGNCALVVGATAKKQLAAVRRLVPDLPLLLPGVGVQGATIDDVVPTGLDRNGQGIIINASSSILYAFEKEKDISRRTDFASCAATELGLMNEMVKQRRPMSR